MESPSVEQAREIVNGIRSVNGGITEEERKNLSASTLRAFENLQSLAGRSIRHVAEDLYDTDTRFIFELLQNAEDNRYGSVLSRNESPYINFTLHDDRLVVDSNEDGFNEQDVRAICSIHRSSKPLTGGYIGHKGIGFKSVFKVSQRVHIQSGPFCFSFQQRRDESGLGMITPSNQEHEVLPDEVRTRITLFLMEPNDFDVRATELTEIPDTLLLFLRKLEKITVNVRPPEQSTFTNASYEFRRNATETSTTLTKMIDGEEEAKNFIIRKATVSDLPEHPSRKGQNDAEVVLAFPIDTRLKPIKDPQYVYSFLPMRREGFNFLIQSDFITQASRQGIHHCPRNYAIRNGICNLFIEAVHYFCHQPSLQYEWLQYLPGLHIMDSFWSDVRETIFDRLKNNRILLTWKGSLEHPETLQHLTTRHCDRRGRPLFDDLEREVYLSPRYNWSQHAEELSELGVRNHSYESMLDRLDSYLQGDKPRFLDPALDDEWHTKVANLLVRALNSNTRNSEVAQRIKRMPLIPISDGSLLKNAASGIYFLNDSEGFAIPGDLELEIVHPEALGNPSRKALFDMLGVTHCDPSQVIESILKRYNRPRVVNLQNSISHLRYLFWSSGNEVLLDRRIYIMDQHERPVYRAFVPYGVEIRVDDLYFPTPGIYGTEELSRKLENSGQPTEMLFIHQDYLDAVSTEARSNSLSWKEWLQKVGCVRCIPRLRDSHTDKLSTLFQNIATNHPLTLVGMLKTYWNNYQGEITPNIIIAVKNTKVPCQNTDVLYPLKNTFFPSTELKRICSQTSILNSFDQFMKPPSEWATDTTDGWEFLAKLKVGLNLDIVFMKQVLRFLKRIALPDQLKDDFFAVYQELSIRFSGKYESEVRNLFGEMEAVYIPATQTRTARITSHPACVWKGNPCLRGKYPLATYQEYSDNPLVVFLFKNILGVLDACIMTYLEELQVRKASPDVLLEDLYDIYGELSKELLEGVVQRTRACDLINKEKLIYIPTNRSWVSPDQCIWTADSKIGGQYGISATYARFEEFFRGILNVRVPTISTYINQLRILVSDQPDNITAIKATIRSIGQLRPSPDDLHGVRKLRFLPIEKVDGSKMLAKATDAFFIADRIEYQAAFHGKVSMLDFSLEEIRRLHRLFDSLSLGDHYMSAAVQERTIVQLPAPEPSSSLTHIFREKAQHLYRCAVHYDAGRLQSDGASIRRRLQHVIIHESDGFKKTVILSQNGLQFTAETDEGLVYIDHSNNRLRIYVPRDLRQRQRCYSTQLPKALVSFLEIEDRTATEVFRLPCLLQGDIIESVLDDNGISRISNAEAENPDSPTETTEESSSDGDTLTAPHTPSDDGSGSFEGFRQGSMAGQGTTSNTVLPTVQHADYEAEPSISQITHRQAASIPGVSVSPDFSEPSADTAPVPTLHDSQYVRLLGHVIMLARQAAFPQTSDILSTATRVNGSFTQGLASSIRSESQLAHDIKIGAAGELYVFELLSKKNLPDFSRHNWRSNVRKEVNVHPEYRDLEPWCGVETADLVYKDTYSVLTRILIDAGYLLQIGWETATPTYFIEVKSTAGACETPFYMSKGQYRRMQSMKLDSNDQANANVYMIFRVYNLGSDGIVARIYLDPETLRERGRLQFTPESYSVSPRAYH